MADSQGKPTLLAPWEKAAHQGETFDLQKPWDDPFTREWLALPPRLADKDLRCVLYVSREHAPLITPADRLSSEGAELLEALLSQPDMAAELKVRLEKIARAESGVIMDRLLETALQQQEWGVPPILDACLVVAEVDVTQGARLASFLADRPGTQIRPNIVPKIMGYPWTETVWARWEGNAKVAKPVKDAIKAKR